MDEYIKINNEAVYRPEHDELNPMWEALVRAHEYFGASSEVLAMKESYIQLRLQSEKTLWETRSWDWQEDYQQEQKEVCSA